MKKIYDKLKKKLVSIKKKLRISKKNRKQLRSLVKISKKEAFVLGLIVSLSLGGISLIPDTAIASQLVKVEKVKPESSSILKTTTNKILVVFKIIRYSALTTSSFVAGFTLGFYINFIIFFQNRLKG